MKQHLLGSLFLLFSLSSFGQNNNIDLIFEDYSNEQPGASVAVIKDGELVFHKGYGLANLEEKEEVTASTNFRLASVSKQFTAIAILQLKEQGKIDLDKPLSEVFENFPDYGKNIRIKNLLNHTSGLWDYEEFVPDTAMIHQVMDEDVLDLIRQQDQVYFVAGEEYRYSNTAYALLALIVEKYGEKDYPDYLEENIFRPLGMKNTVAHIKEVNEVANRAYGYDREKDSWKRRDQSSTSAVLGDGGIYSNVEDLMLWDRALYQGEVIPLELIQKSFTPGELNKGTKIPYGFGWHLKEWEGEKVVYHTGSSTSFRNIFYRIPSRNFSIVILTNRNEPKEEKMVELAEKVLQAF